MAETAYKVSLPVFEGPMDLLMHLVDRHKIDLNDIPIAVITGEYMNYLAQLKEFDIEPASEFLVMAAQLLLIKSRLMLPKPPPAADPEPEPDPRETLAEQLREYRRYKAASAQLGEMADAASRCVSRQPLDTARRLLPPEQVPLDDLVAAFRAVMAARRETVLPEIIVPRERYTVEDRMGFIMSLLAGENSLRFIDLFAAGDREACITTFLALLELIRTHAVRVRQSANFGDIAVIRRTEQ